MQNSQRRPNKRRRGATAVEFAVVAIPFFVLIFACIEMARLSMMESIAEEAAFRAARHVIVAGATKADGIDEANRMLAMIGTSDATITVTPSHNGANQAEIDDDTTSITVEVTVPMSSNTIFLSTFTGGLDIKKECSIETERYVGYYDGEAN
jgi:Flp pilus assembly protein TadG